LKSSLGGFQQVVGEVGEKYWTKLLLLAKILGGFFYKRDTLIDASSCAQQI